MIFFPLARISKEKHTEIAATQSRIFIDTQYSSGAVFVRLLIRENEKIYSFPTLKTDPSVFPFFLRYS